MPGKPALLEERIAIAADGLVTAFSGKVEFGQGIRTGFAQVVADELDVPIERVRVVMGDTDLSPYDWGTFGSHSTELDAPILRRAAAHARAQLLARAGRALGVAGDRLDTKDGHVVSGDRRIAYGDLVKDAPLTGPIPDEVSYLPETRRRYIGRPLPRVEARDIVTGRATYAADVRLPGMLHGAIVRPPVRGAQPRAVNGTAARGLPGVVAVVQDATVVGVVAEREDQARAGAAAVEVDWLAARPDEGPDADIPLREDRGIDRALAAAATRHTARYVLPSIANAPIGPSAAVADVTADRATIYGATHRPFDLREDVAKRIGIPEEHVHFAPRMSSGTYGRSSSFDVALEAAVLSKHAGRPVHLQWTREEEFVYSPSRPEVMLDVTAGLDATGAIVAWSYDEHTANLHTAGWFDPSPERAGGSQGRNAIPPYRIPHLNVVLHMEPTPLRTANFRSLAAAENVFAIESFIDELAHLSHQDPVAFRLRHLDDARLRATLETVADRAGWGRKRPGRHGLGVACTVYHGTSVAQIAEVEVSDAGVVRLVAVWAVVDPGLVINPEGVRNQIEGGIQQSASWTVFEELRHHDGRVAPTSWDTYPIATFRDAPERIDVLVAGDSAQRSTGVGEPGAVPTAAAIANAVFAACGARVRELPLRPDRVRQAIGAGSSA
jgi:CO/xanthine dehydrogenase Mo-binding subunit